MCSNKRSSASKRASKRAQKLENEEAQIKKQIKDFTQNNQIQSRHQNSYTNITWISKRAKLI